MELTKDYHKKAICLLILLLSFSSVAAEDEESHPYSLSANVTTASKYIWRGQRLTDDWSLQPGATIAVEGFAFNVWGNMDLTAVNEGDNLLISGNPDFAGDQNGLRGRFSEVDYTFSYARDLSNLAVQFGTIFYTFPDRSDSLPATAELYGGLSWPDLLFAPSATLFIDIDEAAENGSTGAYLLIGAEHSISFGNSRFPGLDMAASLGVANSGFGEFYYGSGNSGLHDLAFSLSAPIPLGRHWSASLFMTFSALLGDFRDHQFQSPRSLYRGTAGSPAALADTVWGGISLDFGF